MSVWVTIPTGGRPEQALDVVKTWAMLKDSDIKIAAYTWDDETREKIFKHVDRLFYGERKSFAILQNFMAQAISEQDDFDGIVCGADDLYPFIICEHLPFCCKKFDGKALFIYDMVNASTPCHPVITKTWYEKYGPKIFDEMFIHNFCDTDLFERHFGTFVKIEDISFDHRHHSTGKRERDDLDQIGDDAWAMDQAYFNMKHRKTA
jgi:hypothetical protein